MYQPIELRHRFVDSSMRLRSIFALFLTLIAGPLHCAPAQAQKIYRIGFVTPYASETEREWHAAFEQTLGEHGYAPGRNVEILYRFGEGRDELLPKFVSELLRLNVDVLLTVGTPATKAAQRATRTVPIVMVTVLDPMHAGFVANLSAPGGNITGSSELSEELVPKRLELLKEAIPKAKRIAVLYDPTHPTNALDVARTEQAAHALGLKIHPLAAHNAAQIDNAFRSMKSAKTDALIVLTSYAAFVHILKIVELARKEHIPTMYGTREGADAGALLSYGPDVADQYRHAAVFVDKIFKGAKPAQLPIEQPTHFELVLNLTTAKALKLNIPQSIVIRASEIIK